MDEAYTRRTWEKEEEVEEEGEGKKDEEEVEEGEEEEEENEERNELVIVRRNKSDWERENGVGKGMSSWCTSNSHLNLPFTSWKLRSYEVHGI